MALAVAQTIAGQVSNSEASDTASFGAATEAGDLIVVPVLNYNGGGAALPTILDDNGNTWSTAASAGAGTSTRSLIFWSRLASACGIITITPNGGAADHNCHWCAIHATGEATLPLGVEGADNRATNDGTRPDAYVETVGATTVANALVIACMATRGNFGTYNITAPTSGFTDHARQNATAGIGSSIAYKLVGATGVQSATWTHDNDSGGGTRWSASIATFYELVGGGGSSNGRGLSLMGIGR